jgi:hypothetical protein
MLVWLSLMLIFEYFKNPKIKFLLAGLLTSVFAGFTRHEMLFFYAIILIVVLIRSVVTKQHTKIVLLIAISSLVPILLMWNSLLGYYYGTTRFDPFTKLLLGLRYDVILNILNQAFEITGIKNLDFLFVATIAFGIVVFVGSKILKSDLRIVKTSKMKWLRVKKLFAENINVFTLFLVFLSELVLLIMYGYAYSIVNDFLIISVPERSGRYFIFIQTFLVPLFIYSLSVISNPAKISKLFKIRMGRYQFIKIPILFILVLTLVLSTFLPTMWLSGINQVRDNSNSMTLYRNTATWLTYELQPGEKVMLPLDQIFYTWEPSLIGKGISYQVIWNLSNVNPRAADVTTEDLIYARKVLIDYIKNNLEVRYLVVDWMDPINKIFRLNIPSSGDELTLLLREVKVFSYTSFITGWTARIRIYEVVRYDQSFIMNFSTPPEQYFTIPENASLQFNSSGVTIQKEAPYVGFYLPLKEEINSSKQCYSKIRFKLDIEDSELWLTFYYDKNRDGKFSGYETDYVKTVTFSQAKQQWVTGEWYEIYQLIPKTNDPVVQIQIRLVGEKVGSLTLANLVVYIEKASGN